MQKKLQLCVAALMLWSVGPVRADGPFSAKPAEAAPPMDIKEPIRKLLADKSVQVTDGKGNVHCEIWFRKAVPAKATPEQVKNGLTYREVEETTVIGAIRFPQAIKDYRNQTVKPGVYVLRLAFQPQDGDHMGTAPHPEFCLLVAAGKDQKPDAMDPKDLHSLSASSMGGNHPGVLLLFPNEKPTPQLKMADEGMGHWVLRHTLQAEAGGKPATLGIGLTLVGHSSAG
jgi:hypothetical protein